MQKVTIPADRIKIDQHNSEIEHYKGEAKMLARMVNPVLREWNKLNIGDLTIEDLQTHLQNSSVKTVENLVRAKVAGNVPVEVQGIKLSHTKIMEMVEIPDITTLTREWGQLYGMAKRSREGMRPVYLTAVTIENGEAVINTEALNEVIERHTVYAETPKEKEIYLVLEQIAEAGRYLKEKYNINVFRDNYIGQAGDLANEKGKIEINTGAIKRESVLFR